MKVTGKKVVRTEVEFQPAKLIVKQIIQQVAKCVNCGTEDSPNEKCHFQKAAVPVPPLAYSISTPSLIAQVMYQKFALGLPLSRQEKDWYRPGAFQKQYGKLGNPLQRGVVQTCLLEDL